MRSVWWFACGVIIAGCSGGEEGPGELELSVDALAYGDVAVGEPMEQTITLSNVGGLPVELLSVTLTDGDRDVWTFTRTPDVSLLEGGESLDLAVTFAPEEPEASYSGRIQVRTDVVGATSRLIELTGRGAPSTEDTDGDGLSPAEGDCDDTDPLTYPGAQEQCDGRDNDCDGLLPSSETDDDNDGYRLCDDDCDDTNRTVYPGAEEICDDLDNDCDGEIPDRLDQDEDGFSLCDGDCDDSTSVVQPGAEEVCDELDNDCDGSVDDIDEDGDGHGLCTGGGDCDDTNPDAYPVVVDPSFTGTGLGTDEAPYTRLDVALENLDDICRAVWLAPGEHAASVSVVGETFELRGDGPDAVLVRSEGGGEPVLSLSGGADVTAMGMTLTESDSTGDGGAIRVVSSSLTLEDVTLSNNRTTGDGGAVAVTSGRVELRTGVVFSDNAADDDGGGIAVLSSELVDEGGTLWSGNAAVRGGAVLLESAEAQIRDAVFVENSASDTGGAIGVVGSGESGLQLERLDLWRNTASTGGGAIAFTNLADDTSRLRNVVGYGNDGGTVGGALYITGSQAAFELSNNTFVENRATGDGGAVMIDSSNTVGLSLVGNLAAWNNGTSGVHVSSAGLSAGYNLVFATSSGLDFGGVIDDGASENISENPEFIEFSPGDAAEDVDLGLESTSPARDTGPPDSSYDDVDGTRNDRGHTGGPGATL